MSGFVVDTAVRMYQWKNPSSCCSLCKKIIRDREPWTLLLLVHLSLNASVSFSKPLTSFKGFFAFGVYSSNRYETKA